MVDLPPGTGDISLSLAQFLPRAELYVVTTPQPAAQKVAQRAAFMAEKVHLEVKGVIENMSWFTGDDGKRYEIFGAGGGAELAERLEVPLLGQMPLVPPLREGWRLRSSDRRRRPRRRGVGGVSARSPSASTWSWPPPAATTRSSRSSDGMPGILPAGAKPGGPLRRVTRLNGRVAVDIRDR